MTPVKTRNLPFTQHAGTCNHQRDRKTLEGTTGAQKIARNWTTHKQTLSQFVFVLTMENKNTFPLLVHIWFLYLIELTLRHLRYHSTYVAPQSYACVCASCSQCDVAISKNIYSGKQGSMFPFYCYKDPLWKGTVLFVILETLETAIRNVLWQWE